MRGLTDGKALWALGWRMLLLTPVMTVLGVLGTVLLVLVIAATFFGPVLAIFFVISADYGWAFLTVDAWIAWLKFGGSVRRLVFEGFEHGGL